MIDRTILEAEREKLKTDFDNVTNTINTMKGNQHALNGAIQQVDKLSLIHISEPTRQAKSRMPSSA